ncbi:MAG: hypothetical protein WBD31_20100 [Rubripirellula sp.]
MVCDASVDYTDERGILDRVGYDSGYGEHRNVSVLRESVEDKNRMLVSSTGVFKDAMGNKAGIVVAPTTNFADFEHHEADGRLRGSDTDELEDK